MCIRDRIYLDYSATTPVNYDVLESYIRATKDFPGNPNSLHSLGVKSKALMNSALKQISDIFNVLESELTFTSCLLYTSKLNTDTNFASGMNGMTAYNNVGNGTTTVSYTHLE